MESSSLGETIKLQDEEVKEEVSLEKTEEAKFASEADIATYSDDDASPIGEEVYQEQGEEESQKSEEKGDDIEAVQEQIVEENENALNQTPLTPLSWKDAAKSVAPSREDPEMPSFVDQAMIDQIEVNAKQSSANLVVLVHHLRTQLASISSLSVQYMTLHKSTIEGVSEHMHDGIAATQKLILKAQTLNAELRKMSTIQNDIKETKRLLTQLEKIVEKMTAK